MRWQQTIVILAACGTGSSPSLPASATHQTAAVSGVAPKGLWHQELVSYGRVDFAENTAFSTDTVIVAKVPSPVEVDLVGLQAFDPASGKLMWRRDAHGWLLHPAGSTSPLYFAPLEQGNSYEEGYTRVERIDARTGQVVGTIVLDRDTKDDIHTRLVWSESAALVVTTTSVSAFDWTTGKRLWSSDLGAATKGAAKVIGDKIFLPGETLQVLSLRDGKQLAAIPTGCCDIFETSRIVASPDGLHVFVPGKLDETLEIDAQLRAHHLDGQIRAASNRYYALERVADHPIVHRVTIAAYGGPDPILALVPSSTHDFYSALALTDDRVFFFHDADATFSQRRLPAGPVERVDTIAPHVNPASPAFLGGAPAIALPYLFCEDWGIRAYFIGKP
jgi:hypothetical protein